TGADGISIASSSTNASMSVTNTEASVLSGTLSLADGDYVVVAKLGVLETSATAPFDVTCTVKVGGAAKDTETVSILVNPQKSAVSFVAAIHVSGGPLALDLLCFTQGAADTATAMDIQAAALQVGTLTP